MQPRPSLVKYTSTKASIFFIFQNRAGMVFVPHLKADDPAIARLHLLFGDEVLWVALQARVVHARDLPTQPIHPSHQSGWESLEKTPFCKNASSRCQKCMKNGISHPSATPRQPSLIRFYCEDGRIEKPKPASQPPQRPQKRSPFFLHGCPRLSALPLTLLPHTLGCASRTTASFMAVSFCRRTRRSRVLMPRPIRKAAC